MAIEYPQALLDEDQMAESVMDAPRSLGQRAMDFAFGRTLKDKFANAMTSLAPGIIFRGGFKPYLPKHFADLNYFPKFRWFYGDLADVPKFTTPPKNYSALVNPEKGVIGVGIPEKSSDFILHQTMLEEARKKQAEAVARGVRPKPFESGLDQLELDEFGHIRANENRPGYYGPNLKIGAPWAGNIAKAGSPFSASAAEQRTLEQITRILERLNMLPADVPINYERFYKH